MEIKINYGMDACKTKFNLNQQSMNYISFNFILPPLPKQKYPSNGGTPCPKKLARLEECYVECDNAPPIASITNHHHHQQRTNHQKHGIECLYSGWSAWSPCSRSCGDNAVQIRTRTVLNHAHLHLCTERLEERRCDVMPCLYRPYNS